jgi:hypothetical protein
MKKIKVNRWNKHLVAEELATKFYARLGYTHTGKPEDLYFHNSKHPTEGAVLAMAYDAIEIIGGVE